MHRPLLATALALLLAAPAAAQAPASPADTCRNDPKFREQDFTLGSWDVYTGEKKTDEVTMSLILNDCAIEEHWKKTDGHPTGNGIGLFNYSRLLGSWGYTWATDDGAATVFRGNLVKPGEMRYVTEKPLPGGKVRLRHWTLYAMPDGTVRELAIGTEDGGKTWTTDYDLKWVRRK
ncbi:hypothetical protein [Novosphingobium sp.]|uniref:hypothetical protein n=1 Tax=Novosphingobium sp. TaxID=1874826 RepID=UPI0026098B30|nr:hypothetical protein [Novosphingobium sp.]